MGTILHTGKHFRWRFDEKEQQVQLDQLDKDGSTECFIDFPIEAFEEMKKVIKTLKVSKC